MTCLRRLGAGTIALLFVTTSAQGQTVVVPAGSLIRVQLTEQIDSGVNRPGDSFRALTVDPVAVGETVVARAGTPVLVTLVSSKQSGRLAGTTTLKIALTTLVVSGHALPVTTEELESSSRSRARSAGAATGAGALLGALMGALAKKDAAAGATAGAAAGAATQAMRGPQRLVFPAESVYSFVLQEPIAVPLSPASTGVCGPPPSIETFTAVHDTGIFGLRYPRQWSAEGDLRGSATLAPSSGIRTNASGTRSTLCGVLAGIVPLPPATTAGLNTLSDNLLESFRPANPTLVPSETGGRTSLINGREFFIRSLSSEIPGATHREIDILVTTRSRNHLVYLVFVAPADVYVAYQGVFERVLSSVSIAP